MAEGATTEIEEGIRRRIALRLNVLARQMRNRFDREVAELNITRSQWSLIVVVSRLPGATQRTIAETLEMSEASAGRLIDRLCADGLLERQERFDDRRARAVYLTPAAQPLMSKLEEIGSQGEERLFRGFSDAELHALETALDRIHDNLI